MRYASPRFCLSAAIALLSIAGLSAHAQTTSQARSLASVRITQPPDDSSLVTLKGSLSPMANARNDAGPMQPDSSLNRIQLVLKRSPQQESALQQFIRDIQTQGSPGYHKWLTPTQFGQQFGPSDQDIQTIENWVSMHGFQVEKLSPDKGMLEISGTSGQLDSTFHTSMHRYLVDGQEYYANSADPQIPATLAPVLGGFVSLNNFPVHRMSRTLGRASYDPTSGEATPEWTKSDSGSPLGYDLVVSPQDYAIQYDLNPLYSGGANGTGQTIAIINDSNINLDLVNNFRSLFGLPANPPQVIIDGNDPGIDGINNIDGPNGDSIEAYLDVEWAGALAPNAVIDLVIGADTAIESGLILAAERAVYSDIAPVMSVSFGACEQVLGSEGNTFINDLWEQAAAEGITVLVATGDSGSAGTDPTGKYCDNPDEPAATFGTAVNGYASTPYDVAVGGTDFYYSSYKSGSAAVLSQLNADWNTNPTNTPQASINAIAAPLPEQPWNDSSFGLNFEVSDTPDIAGGGGGPSTCGAVNSTGSCAPYAKPSWQTGTGVPNDSARDIPDVSLFAADGLNDSYIPICANDGDCQPGATPTQITGVGGTSAAAPVMAGIMALVNQKYGPQGQADYTLYPLAKQYPSAFHDISLGTNAMPCVLNATTMAPGDCITGGTVSGQGELKGYSAAPGYDLATGLGSIDANQLVTHWSNIHFTPTLTTLTPSATSVTHGTAVTFAASVTSSGGTPSGLVSLMTDSTTPSQQAQTTFALSGGSASGSVNDLPGGAYNVWGQYSGDGTYGASTSSKTLITITPEASRLILTPIYLSSSCSGGYCVISNGTSDIPYGTQIILDGEAIPGRCTTSGSCSSGLTAATGTISFSDNGSAINTAQLNVDGDAEYNSGSYALGKHSITATYLGDSSYSSSTASATTFTVVQGAPTVVVASNLGGSGQGALAAGQTLVLTAQVSGGGTGASPTGSVKFSNGAAVLGTANLVMGVNPATGATVGIATLVVSNVTSTAKNDSNNPFRWVGAGGAALACVFLFGVPDGRRTWRKMLGLLVVAFLMTGLGCGGGVSSTGGSGSGGSGGSGGGGSGGSGGGTGGSGTMSVIASYSGDSNYAGASSPAYTVAIGAASSLLASTTTATASASATSPASAITLSVIVTGQSGHPAPTGTLGFQSSGRDYGTSIPIVAGSGDSSTASFTVNSSNLLQGANVITLQYSGDKNYQSSSSNLSVNNPLSDFSMVAQTPVLTVSSGTPAPGTVTLTPMNGFNGSVALSCTAPGSITCSVSESSAIVNTTVPITISVNATASGTVVVTGSSGSTLSHNVAISVHVR